MAGNATIYMIGIPVIIILLILVYYLYGLHRRSSDLEKRVESTEKNLQSSKQNSIVTEGEWKTYKEEHESNNKFIDWMNAWIMKAQWYIKIPGYQWGSPPADKFGEFQDRILLGKI
tara:strand:- start:3665 stop:4012 length:348 start_codon:yes stop_codon:yes gene_type:complete